MEEIEFENIESLHNEGKENQATNQKNKVPKGNKSAKANNVKVGICRQVPSDYSGFAQFLVEEKIDSISVTPDSLVKTVHAIHKVEQSMDKQKLLL